MRRTLALDGVTYAPGKRFRVVREGCHLSGMVPRPGYLSGWRHDLNVGDVIECTGYGAGWGSDPGYGIEWTCEAVKAVSAVHVDFYPTTGSPFSYRPQAGCIEEVPT